MGVGQRTAPETDLIITRYKFRKKVIIIIIRFTLYLLRLLPSCYGEFPFPVAKCITDRSALARLISKLFTITHKGKRASASE